MPQTQAVAPSHRPDMGVYPHLDGLSVHGRIGQIFAESQDGGYSSQFSASGILTSIPELS